MQDMVHNALNRYNYNKDKAEYLSLAEDKRESWLKEKGYKAEDFSDGVLDTDSEIRYSKKEYLYTWAFDRNLLEQGKPPKTIIVDGETHKISGEYSERNLFFDKIGELNNSNYKTFYQFKNGEYKNKYIFDINNKLVITGGKNSNPSIDGIIEFNRNSFNVTSARDYIYEYVNNGYTVRESIEIINEICQEQVATFHEQNNGTKNRASARQGQNDSGNRKSSQREFNGERVSNEAERPIKFSLKIGNEDIVVNAEQTENLVALHNLSSEKLLKVLDLGGFPMLSIAVTRTDIAHNEFGDISVIFSKRHD